MTVYGPTSPRTVADRPAPYAQPRRRTEYPPPPSDPSAPGRWADPSAPARGADRSPARPDRSAHATFRPDIEGLRAVAVLSVVLYHAGLAAIGGGYVGVDIFFVISGFLITTNLYGELERTGRISFAGFYGRRMIRLLPASTLVVVATVAAAWQWMSPLVAKAVSIDALSAVGYGINYRLAVEGTDYLTATSEPSPLQHFWSLAVEEQFYFVWPLLLVIGSAVWRRQRSRSRPGSAPDSRRGRRPSRRSAAGTLAVLAAGSLALCVWQTRQSQPWAYFGIQARAWELAAGALVALAAPRLARLPRAVAEMAMWLGLAAVLAAAFVYTDATLFPGYAAVLPVTGAAFVVAGGCAGPAGARAVLGIAPLQVIGKLSYSWYLWHWPVLTIARSVAGHPLNTWLGLGLVAASVVPAWLSMRLVENPIRFRSPLRRRPRQGLVLGAALSALTVGAALFFMGLPTHLAGSGRATDTAGIVAAKPSEDPAARLAQERSQLLALIAASAPLTTMPSNLVPVVTAAGNDLPADKDCLASLDATSTADAIAAGCDRYGDKDSGQILVLFGDSHTEQWFDAVNAVALQRHWRLVVLTKSGCTPANALTTKINARRAFTECATWREDAFKVMASLKPAIVLMSTRTYLSAPVDAKNLPVKGVPDALWSTALLDSAKRAQQTGAKVILMQDTPDPGGTSVPNCVAAHPTAVQKCALPAPATNPTRRAAILAAAQNAGIPVIDPIEWFCTDTACPAIIGNTLVYRDGSHVTTTYIKLLTLLLAGQLP